MGAQVVGFGEPGLGVDRGQVGGLFEADDDLAVEATAMDSRALLQTSVEGIGDTLDGEGGHEGCFQDGSIMEPSYRSVASESTGLR